MPTLVKEHRTASAGSIVHSERFPGSRQLRARAPLRVSFAGGGTDVEPFPTAYGGAVLSATIGRFAYGSLTPRSDGRITVTSHDLELSLTFGIQDELRVDGTLDLVKVAVCGLAEMAGGEQHGYDLRLQSWAPPGSGLGSSSTVMVALVGLLRDWYALDLDAYEIAGLAYDLERVQLGIAGGKQDQYAAAFGGFNYIEFTGEQVVVNPLRVRADTVFELEHNLLLCFTGRTRPSDGIIADQTERVVRSERETLEGMQSQKELAAAMKRALLHNRLRDFGDLLNESWVQKKRLSPRITTAAIDEAYAAARRAGALGGKVTGAGGGGFMLIYCDFDYKPRVASVLRQFGLDVEDLSFGQTGLTTWSCR